MDFLWPLIAGIGGIAIGGALAYLFTDRKSRTALAGLQTSLALAQQQAASLTSDLASARDQSSLQKSETDSARVQLADSQAKVAALSAQLASSESNIAQQKKLLDDANQKLTDAFASVSQNALARSNEVFLQMAEARFKTLSAESEGSLNERKAQIATLLTPLQEMLANYQKRLAEVETQRTDSYAALRQQIGSMASAQQTLTAQTTQLASALKKSHVRGRWGEIALQRLAEMSGMTQHVDFLEQESLRNDDGRLLRPDMTVYLPGNRCVVVDSKAVMNAFLDAVALTDESQRLALMQTHAKNVRSRIDDLASKAYWNQFANAPECVVLFIPGEAFLYAACDADPDLIQYALSQRVLLATPTTFISLLLTIEHGWRQEELSQNAQAIQKLGSDIYNRVAILNEHFTSLGKSLGNAVENYNKAVGTLESGLNTSARKMGELGARNDKEIDSPSTVDKHPRNLSPTLPSNTP